MDNASVDYYQIQTIVSFTGTFILGVITFLKAPGNRLNIAAASFFVLVSLWQLDLFIIRGAQTLETANLASRILRPSLILVPAALLSYAILLTKSRGWVLLLEKIVYALAVAAILMCITGIGFKPMVYKEGIGYTAQADLTYLFIIIIILSSLAGTFTVMLRKYFSGSILSQEKKQLQYLMLGVSVGFLGAVINLLNIYGVKIFPMAGFLLLVFFVLMAYSVLTYDLMNIREIFQKTLMFILTAVIIVLIYSVMNMLVFEPIGNNWYRTFLFFICTLLIVLGFEPTLKALDKITRKAFFISNYDFQVLLQHVLFRIRHMKNFAEIFSEASLNVVTVLKLKRSVFFFWDEHRECFMLYAQGRDENVWLPREHPLIAYLGRVKDTVYYKKFLDDLAYDMTLNRRQKQTDVAEMMNLLKGYDAEICVPVLISGEVKGFWIIGEKINKGLLVREEINWIKNIAVQISAVVENIILYGQLMKSERFAMLGRMSAAVAHEIRNPLTGLSGFVQMVNLDRENSGAMDKFLKIAPGEFKRLEKLTDNLLALGRTTAVRQEMMDLTGIVDEILEFTAHMFRDKKISATVNYLPVPKVSIEAEQIKQLVLNLVMNAVQAMENGGVLDVTVSETYVLKKRYVTAAFSDQGSGIAPEILERVFEPFFTTKPEGTGLGLAISRNIMEAHGGMIRAENNIGRGATVSISFPVRN